MKPKRHIRLALLAVLTLFSFGGCAGEAPHPAPRFPWENWLDWERLVNWDTLMVDGRARTFNVHLPPQYEEGADTFPLVIGLHGLGGSAVQFDRHYHFSGKADREGFVAVYPNGVRSDGRFGIRTWNAGTCCDFAMRENVDDVRFISELIDRLLESYRIDPKRVYVTGMSNGGMLTYRLAAEIPQKIAAIAPVSCTMVFDPPADQPRPVPIIHLHSVLDEIIPYNGGTNSLGYHFPPVDSILNVWAARNGCLPDPQVTEGAGYTVKQWVDELDCPFMVHYLTEDGGHSWPGGEQVRPGAAPPSAAINGNELIWGFFQRFHLP
ncbi:polyhydroxybutyrate depolymerase [Parapedobacter composti]|uniref:Polyhydroxybutyrate depolymerase n=1 Tax=Parapedobacter composti TaxID=623281 RepID=A0A1I1F128_9SPHI|nr:PHB depolymerase family esterase [Parapedobacter composti]SFB93024.1 polyhydroxybutyrate depolymerase [Parapedobacter composti]